MLNFRGVCWVSIGDLNNSSCLDDLFLDDAYLVSHNLQLCVSTCRPRLVSRYGSL